MLTNDIHSVSSSYGGLNKLVLILVYLSIFTSLAFPILNIGLVNIGSINVYLYEVPLALSFFFSCICLLSSRIKKYELNIVSIYLLTFVPLIIIGSIGALNSDARIATILAGTRPLVYWLSGLVVIIIGHKHVKLKTLFWIIIAGLIIQFIIGMFLMVLSGDSIDSGNRLIGRSGFLVLFVLPAVYLMAIGGNKYLYCYNITCREYKCMVASLILLLVYVLLMQNRTTWIAMSLLLALLFFKFRGINFKFLSRISIVLFLSIIVFIVFSKTGLIHEEVSGNIGKRIFEDTLSKDGAQHSMLARSFIYEASYVDFIERPILGHGFGHQLSFTEIWNPNNLAVASNMDNSFINYAHKFGILGLALFLLLLLKAYIIIIKYGAFISVSDRPYCEAFKLSFPIICLVSLNIDILFSYPEVIIISVLSSKLMCLVTGYKYDTNRLSCGKLLRGA